MNNILVSVSIIRSNSLYCLPPIAGTAQNPHTRHHPDRYRAIGLYNIMNSTSCETFNVCFCMLYVCRCLYSMTVTQFSWQVQKLVCTDVRYTCPPTTCMYCILHIHLNMLSGCIYKIHTLYTNVCSRAHITGARSGPIIEIKDFSLISGFVANIHRTAPFLVRSIVAVDRAHIWTRT